MKRRGEGRYGLGAASLILILLVLCLALLGVLSLMSARADLGLSRRHAQLAQAYAEAAADMQRALAEMDHQMVKAYMMTDGEIGYANACSQIVQVGRASVLWLDESSAQLRIDAGDERELIAEIRRCPREKADTARYILTKHALSDVKEWEQTGGLVLIDM